MARPDILALLIPVWGILVQSTFAFNCSTPPIYVDIHLRAVHGTDKFQYGSFIGIGKPSQNQSIWPSLRQNETSFAKNDFCSTSSLANCANETGGSFDPEDSSTWTETNTTQSGSDSVGTSGSFIGGKDLLHLFTHYFYTDPATETPVPDVPVLIGTGGDKSPGVLGLGSASTLLQRLVDLKLVVGRTYSLYIGTGFERAGGAINGSNTFGGYDSARFQGPVHTYPMDLSSPDYLPVTVSDIIIDSPSNRAQQKISILDDAHFEARITTDRFPLLLPYAVTSKFQSMLSASPVNSTDGSLRLSQPFNGTMTIKLSDGFNVTFPASMLYNASGLAPVSQQTPDYTGPFYLSASFLTQVYLMLDFETQKFHLAQAVQSPKYILPTTFCPGSTPQVKEIKPPNKFLAKGLIGAVVGGIIGGCAVAVLCWFLFVNWSRQRYSKRAAEQRWADEKKAVVDGEAGSSTVSVIDVEMQKLAPFGASADRLSPGVAIPSPYGPPALHHHHHHHDHRGSGNESWMPVAQNVPGERGLEGENISRPVSPLSTISSLSSVSR